MATDENDQRTAMFAMVHANTSMMREVMQHLVEEGLMEGPKAAQIVTGAADENFPPAQSSGPAYDLGREYLLALAKAFRSFPPLPESPRALGSLRQDLG